MPENMSVFWIGIGIGLGPLVVGVIIGYLLGRRTKSGEKVDKAQFLDFLRNLSLWTNEFSGDVSKYQSQLSRLSEQARGDGSVQGDELQELVAKIMAVNEQLKSRLDYSEELLEAQTNQISDYLTEARTDGLTGLMNRRAFDRATDELYAEWQNKSQSFSIGLIDIDHFKQINDTYGHQAGDEVLVQLGKLLAEKLPDAYCVARYGGEEFAILTHAPLTQAAQELERLRQSIEGHHVSYDGIHVPVTTSGGVAEIQVDDKVGNVVRRSDEALYASKLGGRNRVHLHDSQICRLVTQIAKVPSDAAKVFAPTATEARAESRSQSRVNERLERIVADESRRILDR